MGSGYSAPNENATDKVENVKKLFDVSQNDDFLESLNISELKNFSHKEQLPILGGTNESNDYEGHYNIDFNLLGGDLNNDVRFMSKNRRYLRHNIFKVIQQLEFSDKFQQGGNLNEKDLSTSDDDDAIKHIKQIILKEVNKLNTEKQKGGACGCEANSDSENVQEGGAKKRKSKKSKKTQKGGRREAPRRKRQVKTDNTSSLTKTDSSNSSSSSSSSSSSNSASQENSYSGVKSSYNQSESSLNSSESKTQSTNSDSNSNSSGGGRGGLSIFPFNSSEVKSTVSEKKNSRMIRRKI